MCAINQLGFLDASGIGGPRDYDQAIAQFERAANAGYINAMVNLGRLFDVEEGYLPYERREASEAYFWFRLAGQRGDAEGAEQAARIEDTLSASEMAAVEARLGNWQQQGL